MQLPPRVKPGFVVLGFGLLVIVVYFAVFNTKTPVKPKAPHTSVFTARVVRRDVTETITGLGQTVSRQGVVIQPQISGVLRSVEVREGSRVRRGDLLARIACDPYEAALKQAQGALARDRALLALARLDLGRYQTLVSQDAISKQQADTQAAVVQQDEGTVKIDEGVADAARVNVGYCQIRSPVDGIVGLRLVDPGNIVSPTATTAGLLTVNQLAPISVVFNVPQGDYGRLSAASAGFTRALATTAYAQESGAPLATGLLTIADNHVDPATGTVALKAAFSNVDHRLLPGQFVNIKLALNERRGALTLPVNAVNQGPKGPFAYVVTAAGKAEMRPIVTASVEDGVAVVVKGLAANEEVVVDGQMTLRPGAAVAVARPGPAGAPARPATPSKAGGPTP